MGAWITVIGLGEDGPARLSPEARAAIDAAEVVVGGERHLALVQGQNAERLTWRTPLKDTMAEIAARRGRRVVVLATGDPMWFGVGVTLAKHFRSDELSVLPVAGAFSLAAARLGWPLADTETITLHGRKPALVNAHIAPGARLLVLSDSGETPAQVAAALVARGYPESAMTVFEHMGGAQERRIEGTAAHWNGARAADFNTVAVTCVAGPNAVVLANAPGLPDELFQNDGQLTKRAVRAATIAALMPLPGQVLWDVGAGCGSIAVEWMRAARGAQAFAVERKPARCTLIAANADFFGVPGLDVVEGTAPDALDDLPDPDAVFIGGGIIKQGVHEACWYRLKTGGRLVANVVTLQGESALARLHQSFGGDLARIAVSRAEPVGTRLGWRPQMSVTQYMIEKR